MPKQWQLWNAHGACGACGGPMPGTPDWTNIRCPECVEAKRPLKK